MSLESSEELEVMEGSMIDYANKDYYRSKIKDQDICKEYIAAHSRYSILEILAMFQHDFSTQKNEAINHSVASMAPKTKRSKPPSLITRVMLCAGEQIVGHAQLWKRIFKLFDLQLDKNLT